MLRARAGTTWPCAGWGRSGDVRDYTYGQLAALTSRFANVLKSLGVGKGDRVFVLAGRIPELYIAALGTLKNRSVFCPLFSAFGPEPIRARLAIGGAKVLVTTESLYRTKGRGDSRRRSRASSTSCSSARTVRPTQRARHARLRTDSWPRPTTRFAIGPTDPEDVALLHFTSGTTGTPKGAVHVHEAVVAHHVTGQARPRPASRGHLLVHGRPGLGDRHLLRHHRPVHQRRHEHRRRGGLRRRALVRHPPGPARSPSGTRRRRRSA